MFWGTILIVLGAVLLLKNLGIIQAATWDVLWPVLLILLGVALLKRKGTRGQWWQSGQGGTPPSSMP
jgi:hypothetical protein